MKNTASSWGFRENLLSFRIYTKLTSFHYHQLLSFLFSPWVFSHLAFTNQRTAGKGEVNSNTSLPLPPTSQTLRISQAITEESSALHIATE